MRDREELAGLAAGMEPRTYAEAMKGPDAEKWCVACQEEYDMHMKNWTWDVVELPPGKKAIGSGWVFKIKRNADGSVEWYKGWIVAKGYSQHPGLDYTEVFTPTSCSPAI
jgi:hypothetical protein